ncbi:hypothetical protein TNCV_3760401 [Trichonephila clavipes]|nr:hypothetical protein TNCV_3760401 [Trichonephila clavipes]
MVTVEQRCDGIKNALKVDFIRTIKCYSDYIDSCVKMVQLSTVLIEGTYRLEIWQAMPVYSLGAHPSVQLDLTRCSGNKFRSASAKGPVDLLPPGPELSLNGTVGNLNRDVRRFDEKTLSWGVSGDVQKV